VSCPTIRPLLEMYVDGELDPAAGLELERHLEECHECSQVRGQLLASRQVLRAEAPRFPAPARLRDNIQSSLRRSTRPRFTMPQWAWPSLTAASLLVAVGGVALGLHGIRTVPTAEDQVAQEIVGAHVRSLLADGVHLTDVASANRHTVKPWFAGKIDYPPPVIDLGKEGFDLTGGRLDYINGREVAVLIYKRRLHTINLFVWPDRTDGDREPQGRTSQGYHLVEWRKGGMTYWAVSDLEAGDLLEFARLF
jgi:anti-sigma factor RsiW